MSVMTSKENNGESIHRLKIALSGVKPQVWRRIEVESNTKLSRLSCILLEGMGWTDLHLHQFTIGNTEYGMPDSDFPNDAFDEGKFTLAKVASHVKDRFRLDYDFGDGWEHRVVVEAIEQAAPGVKYPRCTGGANACPPEDCGGPYGYADLLEILADPKHERREELQESFDEDFDPTYFNLDEINVRLSGVIGDKSLYAQVLE